VSSLATRAARHAALGDPARLMIVDALASSDRSPHELGLLTGLASNLLAHHLAVLEHAGVVTRTRSHADGRRRYVRLVPAAFDALTPRPPLSRRPALFVCTRNSARSQLAAALWRRLAAAPAVSAGTHPADRVHPGAVAAARRARLSLRGAVPRCLDEVGPFPDLVVTVCDQAHEELAPDPTWLHWSITDPVESGTPEAFDRALDALRQRIVALTAGSDR
jgi:protein-tyrosine-phosphatase